MKIITMKKLVLLLLTFITLGYKSQTTLEGDKIIGLWEVGSGKARIKVTKYGDKYGGKIVWLRDPLDEKGEKKVDKNNPEETKRTMPLLGLNNLLGFSYKEKGEYSGGTIYDPENGNTYNCVINLEDENTIQVRGYIGVQLFGRTDTWKRVVLKQTK
jgi:uncharacterized protein (DUF2147 family)